MKFLVLLSLIAVASAADSCCKSDITTGPSRSLFMPSLQSCPAKTTFICSAANDKAATSITINGKTAVVTSKDGANSVVEIVCRQSDLKWTLNGQVVDTISCL